MLNDFVKKLTPVQISLLTLLSIGILSTLIFLGIRLSATPLALLYNSLDAEDSALITSRLTAMAIEYKISENGKGVLVPVSKVAQLRMLFAQDGIPRSGNVMGYEIFDKNDSLATSQFVHNVNLIRALEGELSRTISSLSLIENARVHIVLPKKELFSRTGNDTSASIVVKPKTGQPLSKSEIASITHLVATAVPGLSVEHITVIDHKGTPLKLGNGEDEQSSSVTDGISDYQKAVEERLKTTIESLLSRSVGISKVKASVAAEINFDREITNSETFDPASQVLRSKKAMEENTNEKDGANAGMSVTSNLPAEEANSGGAQGSKQYNRVDEVSNYEISKTITNKISETGRIKKLSIAILVDGHYNETKDPNAKADTPPTIVYAPRSDEEIAQIKALASSAVGLDLKRGDKIDVINMRFYNEAAAVADNSSYADLLPNLEGIIRTLVIGIVFILMILLVVRPLIMRVIEIRQHVQEPTEVQTAINTLQQDIDMQSLANAAAAAAAADAQKKDEEEYFFNIAGPNDKRRIALLKQLNELVTSNPEETVTIIRNWIYYGGGMG